MYIIHNIKCEISAGRAQFNSIRNGRCFTVTKLRAQNKFYVRNIHFKKWKNIKTKKIHELAMAFPIQPQMKFTIASSSSTAKLSLPCNSYTKRSNCSVIFWSPAKTEKNKSSMATTTVVSIRY